MKKQIFYIILIALGILALLALLWWWFFHTTPVHFPTTSSNFGSAQNSTTTKPVGSGSTTGGTQTNIATNIQTGGTQNSDGTQPNSQNNVGQGSSVDINGNYVTTNPGEVVVTSNTGGYIPTNDTSAYNAGSFDVPGVTWLIGSTTQDGGVIQNTGGSGNIFSSGGIDSITSPGIYGGVIPDISGGSLNSSGSDSGLAGALIGAGAAGAVACVLPSLAATIGGSFALAVTGTALSKGAVTSSVGNAALAVNVNDIPNHVGNDANAIINSGTTIASNLGLSIQLSELINSRLLDCFARTVAHAALEQIAKSTVQWINSGFNGSPSFVQNSDQFFANVADNAAGQFIKGSSLSFLCSPFQLQVKIAVAQSYANHGAQSCTLNKVISNVTNFMNGDFSSGGWAGLLSFTTTPTNNPYGAYAYSSIGIQSAATNAQGKQAFDLSLSGGFLSIKQEKNCRNSATNPGESANRTVKQITSNGDPNSSNNVGAGAYVVCDNVTVTPGTAIAQTLDQTLGINTQSLSTAKYFDEIISALVGQLIQNVAYKGLANLSSSGNGYVSSSNSNTSNGGILQSILQNIPQLQQSSQQLNGLMQQNIVSIQSSLTQARALKDCWLLSVASSTSNGASVSQAQQNAEDANSIIAQLNSQLVLYQAKAAQSTEALTELKSYQDQAQSTTDTYALQSLMNSLASQIQNGAFTQDVNVVDSQEDQIRLNSDLDTINQTIGAGLQQCHAQ